MRCAMRVPITVFGDCTGALTALFDCSAVTAAARLISLQTRLA